VPCGTYLSTKTKKKFKYSKQKKNSATKHKKKDNVHIFIFSHRFTAKVNSLVLMYLKQSFKRVKNRFPKRLFLYFRI